jgi:hypothetical protein
VKRIKGGKQDEVGFHQKNKRWKGRMRKKDNDDDLETP